MPQLSFHAVSRMLSVDVLTDDSERSVRALIPSYLHVPTLDFFLTCRTVPQDPEATHVLVRSLDDIVTVVPLDSVDPHNPGRGWIPRYLLRAAAGWQVRQ